MSLLDIDEKLIDLAARIELVYGPLVDVKQFPRDVDVALVEGAVASEEDLERIRQIRERTGMLVAFGDCSVTGNVPAMRNSFGTRAVFQRAFHENVQTTPQDPTTGLPRLLERVRPIHEVVKVDVFIPGCPPPADAIFFVIAELLEGRVPDVSKLTRFGR
jgi:NAD-reducing hydrogenase small subunit